MKNGYERFIRPLLFSLDAETAHRLTLALLRNASYVDAALRALSFFQPPPKPKTVFGVTFQIQSGSRLDWTKTASRCPHGRQWVSVS